MSIPASTPGRDTRREKTFGAGSAIRMEDSDDTYGGYAPGEWSALTLEFQPAACRVVSDPRL